MIRTELHHALRILFARTQRTTTWMSIVLLALGIGAMTTIYAVLHAVLLAPLPFADPERVVSLVETQPAAGVANFSVSGPNYLSWRERSRGYTDLVAYRGVDAMVATRDGGERLQAFEVTPNFWQALGLPILVGRSFSAAEDHVDGAAVLIGERLYRRNFGGDPAVIGRGIRVDGKERTVIGVVGQDAGVSRDADLWRPLGLPDQPWARGDHRLSVLARLAPGFERSAADADLKNVAAGLATEFPDSNRGWEARSIPVRDWIVGTPIRQRVLTLAVALSLLLLVVLGNVANLQLARAGGRLRELSVRQALGASRAHVLRQLGAECAITAAIGGGGGLALATVAIAILRSQVADSIPPLQALSLSPLVAFGTALTTLLAVIASTLGPAALAMRVQIAHTLQSAGRAGADPGRSALRQLLTVMQFALATLLVAAAAMWIQEFRDIAAAPLGFEPGPVLTARVTLPDDGNGARWREAAEEIAHQLAAIQSVPGVAAVGMGSEIPLGQNNLTEMQVVAGANRVAEARTRGTSTAWRIVDSNFLDALGVPRLQGRGFRPGEARNSMLVSESLARTLFPAGESAVERDVTLNNGNTFHIVGVVGDVRQLDRAEAPTPTMYMPITWYTLPTMNVAIRVDGDPMAVAAQVAAAARRAAPDHPLFDVRSLTQVAADNIAQPRTQSLTLIAFGLTSLILAAIGLASVTALLVSQRRPELAVRMAVGASPGALVRFVLGRSGALCLVGIVLGGAGAVSLTQVLGLSAATAGAMPTTVILVGVLLALVGLLATWWPARRAAAISPSSVLRAS